MKYIFFLLLASLCIASCDSNRVYEDYKEFKTKSWMINDPAVFEFEITDTTKKYNLYYNVRNSWEYPWQRIFIQYQLTDSLDASLKTQLVSNYLFEKSGKPLGRSGLGDVYDNQFLLLDNYSFSNTGSYRMKLEQQNRQDTLAGILAVGFRIETAQ
jgi:gliding motility-associated lipoprotein GldH